MNIIETEEDEVFISYSWDNEEHIQTAVALSDRLRLDGFNACIDQYEVSPPEGWPRWMERKLEHAKVVIVICTETYLKRVTGQESFDRGNGVKWEGGIIYQHLYNSGSENRKFVPLLFRELDRKFIPIPLQGATSYSLDQPSGYTGLTNRLLGVAPSAKPPLGKRKPTPPKQVKTDFSTFLASPIDVPLWNDAQWRATAFASMPGLPPMLGIVFMNEKVGKAIFESWQRRYGSRDEFEELRVAIIEGEVKGEDAGYTVSIGIDHENVLKRYRHSGLEIGDPNVLTLVYRLNRMNPVPGSPYLAHFKRLTSKAGEYLLVPASSKPDGKDLHFLPELGIRKKKVYFRNSSDIGASDVDCCVLEMGQLVRPSTEYGKSRGKG